MHTRTINHNYTQRITIKTVRINKYRKMEKYTVELKNGESVTDVLTYENWELDSNFLFLVDKEEDTIIINKNEIYKIRSW